MKCINPQSLKQTGIYQSLNQFETDQGGRRDQWEDSHRVNFSMKQLDEKEVLRLQRAADVVMYEVVTFRDSRIKSTGRIMIELGDSYWTLNIIGKPRELENPAYVKIKAEARPC